jgi:hypothetical protein
MPNETADFRILGTVLRLLAALEILLGPVSPRKALTGRLESCGTAQLFLSLPVGISSSPQREERTSCAGLLVPFCSPSSG